MSNEKEVFTHGIAFKGGSEDKEESEKVCGDVDAAAVVTVADACTETDDVEGPRDGAAFGEKVNTDRSDRLFGTFASLCPPCLPEMDGTRLLFMASPSLSPTLLDLPFALVKAAELEITLVESKDNESVEGDGETKRRSSFSTSRSN